MPEWLWRTCAQPIAAVFTDVDGIVVSKAKVVTALAVGAKRETLQFQPPVVPGYDDLLNRVVTIGVNDDHRTRYHENALLSAPQLEAREHLET